MFNTVYHDVFPIAEKKYPGKVQFIFRQQIQPWHPSSTLTHEVGVAVLKLAPEKFYPFSAALFDKQTDFFDVNVVNESRNHTYERLAKLAGGVGIDEKAVLDLVHISDKPGKDGSLNTGNGVTNDLKLQVKVIHCLDIESCAHEIHQANRLVGVHVTPTVLFDVSEEAICLMVV